MGSVKGRRQNFKSSRKKGNKKESRVRENKKESRVKESKKESSVKESKKESSVKERRKEKENKRGEEMNKALTNIQCPDRIVEYLLQEQSAKKEKQENEIVQQMTDGRIPMGFSSHPLWSETHEKVS